MNVDDMLARPREALMLEDSEIIVNAILLVEYVTLDPDAEQPDRRRLSYASSDELEPWTSIGMLRHAQFLEEDAIKRVEDDDQ